VSATKRPEKLEWMVRYFTTYYLTLQKTPSYEHRHENEKGMTLKPSPVSLHFMNDLQNEPPMLRDGSGGEISFIPQRIF